MNSIEATERLIKAFLTAYDDRKLDVIVDSFDEDGELDISGSARVIGQLVDQTCETLLATAFNEDDDGWDNQTASDLAKHVLMRAGLRHYRGLVALDAALNLPVVGLGASAATYYGAVGERLGTEVILPQHAGVANALGAVVGQLGGCIRGSQIRTQRREGRKLWTGVL